MFSVTGKMFVLSVDEPDPLQRLLVKVAPERLQELADQPRVVAAPYPARHH